MNLRRVTETPWGQVVDYIPGHVPDYLLLVRIDETKLPELEASFPRGYAHVLMTANMGDKKCYSFSPILTKDEIKDITAKLLELGAQAFEFRDWRNRISPPTRERVIRTKRPVLKA